MSAKPSTESAPPHTPDRRESPSSRPPPRVRPPPRENAEARALNDEIQRAIATLTALLEHTEQLGQSRVNELRARLALIDRKLNAESVCAAVIGEEKPRKTMFLNALLGQPLLPARIRGPSKLLYLRRGSTQNYLARGEQQTFDFEQDHPDRSREFARRIAARQGQIEELERLREEAARDVDQHRSAADQARDELKGRFDVFESARAEAERMASEIAEQEERKTLLEQTLREQEQALPRILRARPPAWAVWLWLAYGVALLLWFRAFRAYRSKAREITEVEAGTTRLRISASNTALTCRLAEAALDPLASPAESTRARFIKARKRLAELDAQIEHLGREVQASRAELSLLQATRRQQFQDNVSAFYDGRAEGKQVAILELRYPAEHLPQDVVLVDVSGPIAQGSEAEERAWTLVREQADACIFVSEIDARLTSSTKSRLLRALELVPHVLLVLTEIDDMYLEALRSQTPAAWEHLERLRSVAVHRFAGEAGCNAERLLSLLVPAETALEEGAPSKLRRRCHTELERLFQLVRFERSLSMGARMAGAIEEYVHEMSGLRERIERHYEQQVAILEEHRRPDPEQFRSAQISAAAPAVQAAAAQITHGIREALRTHINGMRAQVVERVLACRDRRQLLRAAPELELLIGVGLERTAHELARELDLRADAAVRSIELGVFEALRLRYEIGVLVTRASSPSLHIDEAPSGARTAALLGPNFARAIRFFMTARIALGAVGALLGGSLGSVVFAGVGTWIGAGFGILLLFACTFRSVQRRCLRAVDACLAEPEQALSERIQSSETLLVSEISQELDQSVTRAMSRYEKWISEPLDADRAAVEHYRERLRDLRSLCNRLLEHQKRLAWLSQAITANVASLHRQ